MRSSRTSLPLGESWAEINTSDDANSDQDDAHADQFDKRMKAQRNKTSQRTNIQEPELIMPSIGNNAMDGSRLSSSLRSSAASARNDNSPPGVRARRRSPLDSPTTGLPRRRSQRTSGNQPVSSQRAVQSSRATRPAPNASPPSDYVVSIFGWFLDIIASAFKVLKYPISYGLAIWIFLGLMMMAQNFFLYSIEVALSPLCRIPVLSMLNPSCPVLNAEPKDGIPIAFDEAVAAQSNFEDLMEAATTPGNLQLPREMKAGERLVRDLYQLVEHSSIDSKNELVLELRRYITTSTQTTEGLIKFNGHIGSAVDHILAMSKYTLRVLDGFQIEEESHGAIGQFWEGLLAPFQPIKFTEDLLFDQFIGYTKMVEDEIVKLLSEAEDLQLQLNTLESCTDTIGGIAYKDEKHATEQKDEIYSWLWTRVGGNRNRVFKINSEINLLRKVTLDRQDASRHISNTIVSLLDTKTKLENLRSGLAAPDLLRETRPLSVHIDTILAGAERLEDKRQSSRDRELAYIRSPKDKDAKILLEIGASRTR